jgi:hypothetical protein
MKATVSFHPVDLAFFDETLAPLAAGRPVDPEPYIKKALRLREISWHAGRFPRTLDSIRQSAGPPKPQPGDGLLKQLRIRLEQFDYRPDEITWRVLKAVEPALHIHGRPFFITDGSATRVADLVDAYLDVSEPKAAEIIAREQLGKLDQRLPDLVELEEEDALPSRGETRAELLSEGKDLSDLVRAAREQRVWESGEGPARSALTVFCEELPWRAVTMHARQSPFWTARDAEGLETLCRAVGMPAPDPLVPPARLFAEAIEELPDLKGAVQIEISRPRDVGGYVSPADVPELLRYLNTQGARMIAAATRRGLGGEIAVHLRKIKECATYAERHSLGYLEAAGVEVRQPAGEPVPA